MGCAYLGSKDALKSFDAMRPPYFIGGTGFTANSWVLLLFSANSGSTQGYRRFRHWDNTL